LVLVDDDYDSEAAKNAAVGGRDRMTKRDVASFTSTPDGSRLSTSRANHPAMASRHLSRALLELEGLPVERREGHQRSTHEGSLAVARGRADDGVTITLSADPTAAREAAMSVTLSAADVAPLEDALDDALDAE
jgi:hypothetical protein